MNFVDKLLVFEGMDTILAVVDRLSKFGHFIALKHPFSAVYVAKIFLDNIFKLHGLPD